MYNWTMSKSILSDPRLLFFKQQGFPVPTKRILNSPQDIEGIRKACSLTKSLLDEVATFVKPGITTNDINAYVHDLTLAHGAIPAPLNYKGFPKSVCTSLNEVVCHGIPSDRVLVDGDILNVDITCILDGYYGDSCRMYLIGDVAEPARRLVSVTKECLDLAIAQVKPFNTLKDIAKAIETHAHAHGYSVVEVFGGHGIGKQFHQDPFVYHYVRYEKQMVLVPSMTFTIEPMINMGKPGCRVLSDKWTAVTQDGSLSAQWEHTVLVTETGVEILTA